MMRSNESVETEGKDVEDAVAEALARLGISRAEAEIEILEEPKKGLLGIGSRNAKVRVSRASNEEAVIRDTIVRLTRAIDDGAKLNDLEEKDGRWYGEIETQHLALMLGRRGTTLDSVQSLAAAMASKKIGGRVRIALDSGGFREKRREALVEMASQAASDAIEHNEDIHLEPMSSADRKIVHASLAADDRIETLSEDRGDRRHVVIRPKGSSGSKPSRPSGRGRGRRGGSRRNGNASHAAQGRGRGGPRRGDSRNPKS